METKKITIVKKTDYEINYEVFKDYVYFEIKKKRNKKKWEPFAMPITYFNEKLDPKNKQSFNRLINLNWDDKYMAFKKSFMKEYYAGRANWTEPNRHDDLLDALRKGNTDTIFRDSLSNDGFFYVGDKPILKGVKVELFPPEFKDFKVVEERLRKNKKVSEIEWVDTDYWEMDGRGYDCDKKMVFTYTPSNVEFNKWRETGEKYWTCHINLKAKEALQLKKYERDDSYNI